MESSLAVNNTVRIEVGGQIKELDVVDFAMADPCQVKNWVLAKILAMFFRKSNQKLVKVHCPNGKIVYYELFENIQF